MEFNQPNTCACNKLRRATRAITSLYSSAFYSVDLQCTQFTLLATLNAIGDVPVSELAQFMATDRTTLTRNMKLLIEQGFIKVRPGEDKRVKIVHLTKKGKTKFEQALPLWTDIQTKFVDKLGKKKFEQLLRLLKEVEDVSI